MSMRIDLDLQHGQAEPRVAREADGHLALTFTRPGETVVLHLSHASLEALWLALTVDLSRERRS